MAKRKRKVNGEQFAYNIVPNFRYTIGQDVILNDQSYFGRVAVVLDRYINGYNLLPVYVLGFRGECYYIEREEALLDPFLPLCEAR